MKSNNSKKLQILIKTDGDNKIGMGHIYRCMALSHELKNLDSVIQFLIPKNKIIENKLKKFGKCFFSPNNETKELKLIKKLKPDIIIIDILPKYFQYRNRYLKKIKNHSKLLVMLDFIQNGSKYADLSFHSLFYPKKKFCRKTFSSLDFLITRNEFFKSRKHYKLKKNVKSILILQGGADTKCISPKILKSLESLPLEINLTLIVGSKFNCWTQLKSITNSSSRKFCILHDVKNISYEMRKHDLAITAGGNTMIELLTIGIPSIIICGEQHEMQISTLIANKKMVHNLGFGKNLSQKSILKETKNLIKNYEKRKILSKNSKKIIDGKGGKRVAALIYSSLN